MSDLSRGTGNEETSKRTRWFILVRFLWFGSWHVAFFEEDQKTQLPVRVRLDTDDRLRELHEKWGVARTMSDRTSLEVQLAGRQAGEFWINIGRDEYLKLRIARHDRKKR